MNTLEKRLRRSQTIVHLNNGDPFGVNGLTRKEAVHKLLFEVDERVLLANRDEATAELLVGEYIDQIMLAVGKHRRRKER